MEDKTFWWIMGILIFCLIFVYPIFAADTVTITNQSGTTWIRWQWDTIESYDVLIDGHEILSGVTQPNYIIVSDLAPASPHDIRLLDADLHVLEANQTTWTLPVNNTSEIPFTQTMSEFFLNPFVLLIISWIVLMLAFKAWPFVIVSLFFGFAAAMTENSTTDDFWIKIAFWFSWVMIWIVIAFVAGKHK